MTFPVRCIAVLGAPGTGGPELILALRNALAAHADLQITDHLPPRSGQCLALLMGLDPACINPDPGARRIRADLDKGLRQELHSGGWPYRVIYGTTPDNRLANALHALGLPSADIPSRQAREQAQFDLNRGRTPWSCEKCSDPDCEHRLFTGLLRSEADQRPRALSAPSRQPKVPERRR